MIQCFSKNALLIGVFLLLLYMFDVLWVFMPNLSSMATLGLTIGLAFIAFKLASILTNFLFSKFFSRHLSCSIPHKPQSKTPH